MARFHPTDRINLDGCGDARRWYKEHGRRDIAHPVHTETLCARCGGELDEPGRYCPECTDLGCADTPDDPRETDPYAALVAAWDNEG